MILCGRFKPALLAVLYLDLVSQPSWDCLHVSSTRKQEFAGAFRLESLVSFTGGCALRAMVDLLLSVAFRLDGTGFFK